MSESRGDGFDADDLFGDNSPFTRCDECGSVHRTHTRHSCTGRDDGLPDEPATVEDREELSQADNGDADDAVLYVGGRPGTAYHDVTLDRDEQGRFISRPACGANIRATEQSDGRPRTWRRETRGDLRDGTGHYPCRLCHDLTAQGDE